MTINFKKFFNCFIIGNFSLRVSLAKLSCFKEKHLPAVTLRNWCSQKSLPPVCNFIKRETTSQLFSSEFGEILNNTFFTELSGRLFLLKVNFIY